MLGDRSYRRTSRPRSSLQKLAAQNQRRSSNIMSSDYNMAWFKLPAFDQEEVCRIGTIILISLPDAGHSLPSHVSGLGLDPGRGPILALLSAQHGLLVCLLLHHQCSIPGSPPDLLHGHSVWATTSTQTCDFAWPNMGKTICHRMHVVLHFAMFSTLCWI